VEARVPVGFDQHDSDKVRGSAHARQARTLEDRLH
jgi:tRNA-splicing ligase RtcB